MDTSRMPPPQGPPPSYAFVTRVYTRSLRPVVLTIAVISGLWALFSSIGFFRAIGVDKEQHQTNLANLSIALGVLYMVVCVIEVFGIVAATTQRLQLVRLYAYLSGFNALLAVAAGFVRVIVHFTQKQALIDECTDISTGDEIVFRFGLFGPSRTTVLDEEDAKNWCTRAWNHDSVSEIIELLIIMFLAGFFTVISFSFYRQVLDPSSAANASRAPSYQARAAGHYPQHYNPPYNASVPNLGYGAGNYGYNMPYTGPAPYGAPQPQYAPPPGPPPTDNAKDIGYSNQDKKEDNDNPFDDFDHEPRKDDRR